MCPSESLAGCEKREGSGTGVGTQARVMDEPEGAKERRHFPTKYFLILGFLFTGAVIALITVAVTQNHNLPKNSKYGIVLDAGSSHTNVYIYEWPAEKENDTGVVKQMEVCEVKGPGISSYSHDANKAGISLQQCMDRAKAVVPQGKHHETPVYLGATAGMRLLSLQSKNAASQVLSSVTSTLRSYPFSFRDARILSGQEEGAYGWITINYLLGRFKEPFWPRILSLSAPGTIGALDLGGASTQITFVPKQGTIESLEDTVSFLLYGKNYTVYTHSFLCYGKDQALNLKLAKDVQDAESSKLQDPCFQLGYRRTVNISDLQTNSCTAPMLHHPSFSQFQIEGAGDYEKCQTSIERIFNVSYCPYTKCSFNGIFLPHLQGDFGAFSAFYYVMNFLNVTEEPMEKVIEAVKTFCSKSWDEVKAESPTGKEKYLSEYCFAGTYIILLLTQSYTFTKEEWQHIRFMGKIDRSDAGWTLGYMLNLTNMIPAEKPFVHPLSHASYVSLMTISSILMVAVVFIGWMIYRKPKCLRKEII